MRARFAALNRHVIYLIQSAVWVTLYIIIMRWVLPLIFKYSMWSHLTWRQLLLSAVIGLAVYFGLLELLDLLWAVREKRKETPR